MKSRREIDVGNNGTDGRLPLARGAALLHLNPLRDELFPAEQPRLVALLVECIDIGTDRVNVGISVDGLREMLAGGIEVAA